MNRRVLLAGAVCWLCTSACASASPPSTLSTPSVIALHDASAIVEDPDPDPDGSRSALGPEGRLAAQTGYCDLGGVLAARGSAVLAVHSCAQDIAMEHELADDLVVSPATTRHEEARFEHRLGDVDKARSFYKEAIAQDDGRSDITGVARANLGLLEHEAGNAEVAREHLRWVIDHARDDATVGAAHHNLALAELALGHTDAALASAEIAHAKLVAAAGPDHASTGASLNVLGVIQAERGELDAAVDYLEAAVTVRRGALGDAHPAVAASLTNLGVALGRRGDHDDALVAHRRALEIDEVVLGPHHAVTASDHAHIGASLSDLGRHTQARESFLRALAILEPERPHDDPEVLQLRAWLQTSSASAMDDFSS